MKKHCAWYVESDDSLLFELKPTKKSADRFAQRYANETGERLYYYPANKRRKAYRRRKEVKVFLVYPK